MTLPESVLAQPDLTDSREQVLSYFRNSVYGQTPSEPWELSWTLLTEHTGLSAVRRQQWGLDITTALGTQRILVLVDLPATKSGKKIPAFLGLNFHGNHATTEDPQVFDVASQQTVLAGEIHYDGLREEIGLPVERGSQSYRWPAELITGRGYAAITACYLQVGPDSSAVFERGIYRLFSGAQDGEREPAQWGALSIWSWLLSRIMDAIEAGVVPEINSAKVMLVGHSRLGKAALWAGAQDERFAGVISNNSGCMGAALSRDVGETPELLAQVRPYWFPRNFNEPVLAGVVLPVDQFQLLTLVAPRLLYVASASDDAPADPEGEFASLGLAISAWDRAEADALPAQMPSANEGWISSKVPVGYHLRKGEHEMTPWDWKQWLDYTDRWL